MGAPEYSVLRGKRILVVAAEIEKIQLRDSCEYRAGLIVVDEAFPPDPLLPYFLAYNLDCGLLHNVALVDENNIVEVAGNGKKIVVTKTGGRGEFADMYQRLRRAGIPTLSRYSSHETLLSELAKLYSRG